MAFSGQAVHIGCAFSLVEIFSVLYEKVLNFNSANPLDPERDYLVLSKGHGVMAQYACFYEMGWIDELDVNSYFADGSRLHGLSESHTAGCEVTSGSLGHGLPIAVGIAKGLQLKKNPQKVFTIVGDGELNEGSVWEALLFAAHHQLQNFLVIVDANEFQAMGKTSDVMNMEPLAEKFTAFGFETLECDGHDLKKLAAAFVSFNSSRPKALIARTIKGKGVSFMENNNNWHYTRLTEATLASALAEIESNPAGRE